jgi:hypothetical protein
MTPEQATLAPPDPHLAAGRRGAAQARRTFDDLAAAFELALGGDGSAAALTRYYTLAGRPVRVRVLGSRLAEALDRPFRHLRREPVDDDAVGLFIDMWDEAETGVTVPGIEAAPDLAVRGQVTASDDGRVLIHERAQTVAGFDRAQRRIAGWVGDARQLTLYEQGRPLHSALLLWHQDRRVQPVHAGLVSLDGQGILLGGQGGSGKSTTALACLKAGFQYQADDYVGVERTPDGYVGHSMYSSTHLEPHHLERFPWLSPYAIPGSLPGEDKSLVLLADAKPDGLSARTSIRALALPRVVDAEETRVRPASRLEALLRLAPSTLLQLPHACATPDGLARLGEMVETIPTFWLELGRDMERIPDRVARLLTEVTS